MDTFYFIVFLLLVLGGSVGGYVYYLKEKTSQLDAIRRGFCPACKQNTIILTDKRSAGCCGPQLLTYECETCGYTNTFSVDSHSCGL